MLTFKGLQFPTCRTACFLKETHLDQGRDHLLRWRPRIQQVQTWTKKWLELSVTSETNLEQSI
uniref:Uncharacterized protein n=1 Tax=Arion vulgaris TaxID=1028688 RepID=A0A0B7AZU0_9EUPU